MWQRCPKRFEFKYIRKLEPKWKDRKLELGTWLHALLEVHYDGGDWKRAHKLLAKRFNNYPEEVREELGLDLPSHALRIFRSYLRYWQEEDQHFTVVDSEVDEIVKLKAGLEFRLIIDLIVEDDTTGLLWLWDHKSREKFESSEGMILDPQLTNYFSAAQTLGYKPLGGVLYNELRTKAPTIPRLLNSGGLSKAKNIDTDSYTYMKAIRQHGLDPSNYTDILMHIAANEHERFFRRVKLPKDRPMLKTMWNDLIITAKEIKVAERTGDYRRTFIPRDCKWSCDFKAPCIAELYGGDIEPLLRQQYRPRKERDEVLWR